MVAWEVRLDRVLREGCADLVEYPGEGMVGGRKGRNEKDWGYGTLHQILGLLELFDGVEGGQQTDQARLSWPVTMSLSCCAFMA